MANIFPIDFEEKLTMAQDDYILFSDSEDGNKIKKAQYKNLKGEKWDTWATWPQWPQGIQWPQGEQGIQWPQWEQWEQGIQWETWETWARINSAAFSGDDIVFGETDGNTVTLANAKTTLTWPQWPQGEQWIQGVKWDTWATWPQGETWPQWEQGIQWPKWDTGATWPTWPTWPAWNWISTITETTSWKVHTITITETDWDTTSFTVSDGADGEWAWDVVWPASSTDGDIVLFDGNTGKIIKDSWKTVSWLESSISANTTAIGTINWKIPSAATSSNQLADKNYVDSSINSVTAYYITKNAAWDQFATYAELAAATTFYSWGEVRVPTRNDYTIVLDDETHSDEVTRYIYNSGWEYQYSINESPMTQAQLNALNSWITSAKVTTYDWYATGKQDTLVSGTNIKTINNTSVLWDWNISVQPTLVNQSNIKSINWNNILGSGNLILYASIQVTLTAANWSDNEITVTATGVTADNSIIVSPSPESISDYATAMVYCSAQASNSLTFTCTTAPENDIVVNVLILN